jgi:hypothetical protein
MAAIARVRAKHAALDRAQRRGAVSEDAAARTSSKLAQVLNEGHAIQFKRQTGDKRHPSDILSDMRRFADHLDAAGLMHPSLDPEDAAGLHANGSLPRNGDMSAAQQGDATERQAARPDLDAMMAGPARMMKEQAARWRGAADGSPGRNGNKAAFDRVGARAAMQGTTIAQAGPGDTLGDILATSLRGNRNDGRAAAASGNAPYRGCYS